MFGQGSPAVIRLSVVVPFTQRVDQFESTLVSVLENRPSDCEVVVVNDGTYADPYDIGDEVRFVNGSPGKNLLELLNFGGQTAVGEVLHFVLPGMIAQPGWATSAIARFSDARIASVSPGIRSHRRPTKILAGVSYRGHGKRVVSECSAKRVAACQLTYPVFGPTLFAGFYRRSFFELTGGFDSTMSVSTADIDLGLTLSTLGLASVFEPNSLLECDTPPSLADSQFSLGKCEERLFWKHRQERGNPGAARRLLGLLGELLSRKPHQGLVRIAGRLLAKLSSRHEDNSAYQVHVHESAKIAEFLIKQAEFRQQEQAVRANSYRRAA